MEMEENGIGRHEGERKRRETGRNTILRDKTEDLQERKVDDGE